MHLEAAGISHRHDGYLNVASPLHRLDARAKVLTLSATVVVCVSTPAAAFLAFYAYAMFLLVLAIVGGVPARMLLRRWLMTLPFVGLIAAFLPFLPSDGPGGISLGIGALELSPGGLLIFWNVMIKATLAVIALTILTATTPFADILRALGQLGVPRLFLQLLSFAHRYTFVLVDEALRMKRAHDARYFGGRRLPLLRSLGLLIGTLFLRAYERGERVYLAMLARGYEGKAVAVDTANWRGADAGFAAGSLALLAAVRIGLGWSLL